ncbi:hypothetical protein [Streptomyces sp. NPDC059003]|uniref:hypothetical protein n=1 Tax=Streptomyces sp. NPDC059003 TaxID=3346691 RepID=UPI003674FA12
MGYIPWWVSSEARRLAEAKRDAEGNGDEMITIPDSILFDFGPDRETVLDFEELLPEVDFVELWEFLAESGDTGPLYWFAETSSTGLIRNGLKPNHRFCLDTSGEQLTMRAKNRVLSLRYIVHSPDRDGETPSQS